MKLFKFSTSRRTLDRNHTDKETLSMGATCQTNAPKQNERMPAGPINAKFIACAMDAYGSMVLRLALSHVRSMPDAEDVFQDVFVRLMGCQTDFASSEHLKAWLIRTTINRCRDAQRARTRTQTHTEPLSERHAETLPDHQTTPPGFEPDIWNAVGALPEDQRLAVHLHYVEGYATEEIARIANCAPATIRTRLFRARETLRNELGRQSASSHGAQGVRETHEARNPAQFVKPPRSTRSPAQPLATPKHNKKKGTPPDTQQPHKAIKPKGYQSPLKPITPPAPAEGRNL